MMKTTKGKLKTNIKRMFNRFGYELRKIDHMPQEVDKNFLLKNFFELLVRSGFHPKHIIDVGANHGTWTRFSLKYFPNSRYSLLEPQEGLRNSFEDLIRNYNGIKYFPLGAGKEKGTFKFTLVDRDDSCSFRFSEKEAQDKGFVQLELPIITLNSLVRENHLLIPDIVKIDAEGLDLDVLEGSSDFFGKTEVFLVEAGIMNKTFGNDSCSVINYMDQKGYRLFDITDLNRPFKSGVLWLAEFVFIKKNGELDCREYKEKL